MSMNLAERITLALPRYTKKDIHCREASSILTRATGFIDSFDYTLNPSAGCVYCYAAFFPRSRELRDTWGDWVHIKAGDVPDREGDRPRARICHWASVQSLGWGEPRYTHGPFSYRLLAPRTAAMAPFIFHVHGLIGRSGGLLDQCIAPFVVGVSRVSLDPAEGHFMSGCRLQELIP